MNIQIIYSMLSRILAASGAALLLPLLLSLYERGPILSFLLPMLLSAVLSLFLKRKGAAIESSLTPREGTAITALSWIAVSLLYALPYWVSGSLSPLDSLVESISGLTGTGATVFPDLTSLPDSLLFFRSLTHWLGGLGIIVFFVALFPQAGRGTVRMMQTESTGPTSSKALPRIRETARALFAVYAVFTSVCFLSYLLCGLSPLDALNHAFSTIATGGFSTRNESIAYYHDARLEMVIAFFMIISSANFGIYVEAWKRGVSVIWKDTEFRTYLSIVAAATLLMTLSLVLAGGAPLPSLRETFFHAASISSTTGFVAADFDQWPDFCRFVIFLLILIGGCGGSTAGGMKVIRLILLGKSILSLLKLHLHPRAVQAVSAGENRYPPDVLYRVLCFFFLYIMLAFLWAAIMMFDGLAFLDALGVSFSTMGSVGPAFGQFGATQTYAALPTLSKMVVCISMLFGRLESITLMCIFIPSFWKRSGW